MGCTGRLLFAVLPVVLSNTARHRIVAAAAAAATAAALGDSVSSPRSPSEEGSDSDAAPPAGKTSVSNGTLCATGPSTLSRGLTMAQKQTLLNRMDASDYGGEDHDHEGVPLHSGFAPDLAVGTVIRRTPVIVFVYVAIAAMSNALFGFEQSVISAAKIDFSADFNISSTSFQYGFLASGNPIGATFGAVGAGFLQQGIGRRFTLILACLVYIGAVAVSYYSNGFGMLAWGRLQTGIAIGLFSSTAPMYIAELSPPHIRGKLVTVNQVCICSGILLGFVVDKLLTPQWRYMFAAGLPLAILLLLSFIFVTPFSPRWLMTKGREEEARTVLLTIRGAVVGGKARPEVEEEVRGRARRAMEYIGGLWRVHAFYGARLYRGCCE